MARSGTTLLDKLISLHPDAIVLSQPLPLLYVAIKKEFLACAQRCDHLANLYPLNDLVGDNYYHPATFESFLNTIAISRDFLDEVLLRQISYDGQYHKPDNPLIVLNGFESDSFAGFVDRYTTCHSPKSQALVRGTKETTCEEFVPYLLGNNVRVIIVVRDPRDVLASLNFGRGRQFAGRRKPALFNIRQWRKSAAFILAHENDDRVLVVRYEDLVGRLDSEMSRVMSFVGLTAGHRQLFSGTLRSQSGEVWRGNSSHFEFDGVSDRSVGRYGSCLSRDEDRFVQALCYAEMRRLGYSLEIRAGEVSEILVRYVENCALEREELAFYQWSATRRNEELARWRALTNGKINKYFFLSPDTFLRLRAAI